MKGKIFLAIFVVGFGLFVLGSAPQPKTPSELFLLALLTGVLVVTVMSIIYHGK